MPEGTINFEHYSIGTISFDLAQIYASGGPDFPVLNINAQVGMMALTGISHNATDVNAISLVRIEGDFCSPAQRVVARFQNALALRATNPHREVKWQMFLTIPFDLKVLKRIEETRSDDLQVALQIRLQLGLHNTDLNGGGVKTFYIASTTMNFAIPRSQWTDKLLPGLGYGGLEVLEVRYGTGLIAKELPKSVAEIQQARKYLLEADWNNAIEHCRKAIEVILNSRPPSGPVPVKFKDRVNTFIQDHLRAIDPVQSRLLAEEMGMIWEVGSQAVHPATGPAFKRADAEFIVRTTMALVEYFSRLLS